MSFLASSLTSDTSQWLHDDARFGLMIVRRSLAAVNIICSVILGVWLLWSRFLTVNFWTRTVGYLLLSNAFYQCGLLFGNPADGTALCEFQALWQTYFYWTLILWCVSISAFGFFIVVLSLSGTRRQEAVFVLVCYGLPIVIVALPFIDSTEVYGSTGEWCWIRPEFLWWRLGSLYIPLTLIIIATLTLWAIGEWRIRRIARLEAAATLYQHREKKLTTLVKSIIKRSRFLLSAFIAVWASPMLQRVIQAFPRWPPYGIRLALAVLATISLPAFFFLVLAAYWMTVRNQEESTDDNSWTPFRALVNRIRAAFGLPLQVIHRTSTLTETLLIPEYNERTSIQ